MAVEEGEEKGEEAAYDRRLDHGSVQRRKERNSTPLT